MGSRALREGKVPWDLVARAVQRTLPSEVLLGPACGEDAALVRIGGETWAVASDPVSFAASGAGRLSVTVNANDIAVRGARPRFFTAVVLLGGDDASEAGAAAVLDEVREACEQLGVALIGGHTEVTPGLSRTLVVGTMLGRVEGRPITTGGLGVGDRVGMVRWAGLEGTAILLGERGERLRGLHGPAVLRSVAELLPEGWLSVVEAALLAAANPHVSALHDVTEGGVGEALHELATASGRAVEVDRGAIPVLPETRLICEDLGLDPLGLIGSGALLVGCRDSGAAELEVAYSAAGLPFAWIGRALAGEPGVVGVPRIERDEILKASLLDPVAAFVLDLDGTLVDSPYDWPGLRRQLGVEGPSLIDGLNGLASPHREAAWQALEEAERAATAAATLHEGTRELLDLLRRRDLPVALVTNNTAANAHQLLETFQLSFDVVLTRDDGVWKPSGAPLLEAARRLGVPAERCVKVGDSRYDLDAAREAGYGRVVLLGPRAGTLRVHADHAFSSLHDFVRYLQVVL